MTRIAAVLLALPLTAGANELDLFLQYEGTIDHIQGCRSCVDVKEGEPVSGVLRIKTSLAPSDRNPDVTRAEYGNQLDWTEVVPDFVTGHATGGRPNDYVSVVDTRGTSQAGAGLDSYGVRDSDGWGTQTYTMLTIFIQTSRNVIEGDGIVQTFDVAPIQNERFFGAIFQRVAKGASEVYFNLTRVSLTPGSCRA
jgi:hypothetical protein